MHAETAAHDPVVFGRVGAGRRRSAGVALVLIGALAAGCATSNGSATATQSDLAVGVAPSSTVDAALSDQDGGSSRQTDEGSDNTSVEAPAGSAPAAEPATSPVGDDEPADGVSIEVGTWIPDGFAEQGHTFTDGPRLLAVGADDLVAWRGVLFVDLHEPEPTWVLCGAVMESAPPQCGFGLTLDADPTIATAARALLPVPPGLDDADAPSDPNSAAFDGYVPTVISEGVVVEGHPRPDGSVRVTSIRPADGHRPGVGLVVGGPPTDGPPRRYAAARDLFARAAEARRSDPSNPLAGVSMTGRIPGGIWVSVDLADAATVAAIVDALDDDIPLAITSWGEPVD